MDFDGGAALRVQRHHGVRARPVRSALVDVGEHENPPYLAKPGQVDPQVLALGALTRPIIPVEGDDGAAVVARIERVSEGLNHAFSAIAELVEAAEVQVDGRGSLG